MNFGGIDLHKKTITVCVANQERTIVQRKTWACSDTEAIRCFFAGLRPFGAVVEATASYEWLWQLLEPLAERLVLAHPKKLRLIAESARKSDKLDAQILAEFLALDLIPEAYRPTPRQRQHRALVRQRYFLGRHITAVKNKIRHVLAAYNAGRRAGGPRRAGVHPGGGPRHGRYRPQRVGRRPALPFGEEGGGLRGPGV